MLHDTDDYHDEEADNGKHGENDEECKEERSCNYVEEMVQVYHEIRRLKKEIREKDKTCEHDSLDLCE